MSRAKGKTTGLLRSDFAYFTFARQKRNKYTDMELMLLFKEEYPDMEPKSWKHYIADMRRQFNQGRLGGVTQKVLEYK